MPARSRILLNADLGEGGPADEQLIPLLDIANIACGAHAGDQATLARAVAVAIDSGCIVSAHPGYPDPGNFGRRSMKLDREALQQTMSRQLENIRAVLQQHGKTLELVKPHGALYNDCAANPALANALLDILESCLDNPGVIGLAGSALEQAALSRNMQFMAEGFADRRYLASGKLAPRSMQDACIADPDAALAQARQLINGEAITALDGTAVLAGVQTLCVHGDNPDALGLARAIAREIHKGSARAGT